MGGEAPAETLRGRGWQESIGHVLKMTHPRAKISRESAPLVTNPVGSGIYSFLRFGSAISVTL